jgi:hypothetical protein
MKWLQIGLFLSFFANLSYAQDSYLLVSSGGGVTGTATVYKITRDGKVLKGQGLGEIAFTEEGKLKKCKAKKYFKGANAVLTASPDFVHPGNLYTSLTLSDEGKERKITWGDTAHPAPEDAKELHQKINTALSKLTFTTDSPK